MASIYERMKHNYEHKVKESGVHTYLYPIGGTPASAFALRYHWTDVVTAYQDGRVVLTSGGWRTSTTKERINRYLPVGYVLYQQKKTWWLSTPDGTVEFEDDMVLQPAEESAA